MVPAACREKEGLEGFGFFKGFGPVQPAGRRTGRIMSCRNLDFQFVARRKSKGRRAGLGFRV